MQKKIFIEQEGDNWFKRNKNNNKVRFLDYIKTIKDLEINPKSILEIGCGDGYFLNKLKEEFKCDCYGVDPSGEAINNGKTIFPMINLKIGTADNIPFKDIQFDLIIYGFCLYLCDREDLFKIAFEADKYLVDKGFIMIYDFNPAFPFKNKYSHYEGVYSFKMDYSKMFSWNPVYFKIFEKSFSHEGSMYRDKNNERLSISIIQKNFLEAYLIEPYKKTNQKIFAIIQARLASTRLPKKVLKKINGKPLIAYCLEQLKTCKNIDKIIVASTTNPDDIELIDEVKSLGYHTFAGSEDDVLDRYYQAAKNSGAKLGDIIVRITSDCPLIDPEIVDKVILKFKEGNCDYCSNVQPPTFPDGLDVEVFSYDSLHQAWKEAKLPSHREHVTFYLWKNPEKFKIQNVSNVEDYSDLRLTVDEIEDFNVIEKILTHISKRPILLSDILELKKKNPNLFLLNKKFNRNEGHEKSLEKDKQHLEDIK